MEACINYDETQFSTERSLKLFHWEGSGWKNITISIDTVANIICGETINFSPFIIAEKLSTAVTLQNFSARLDGNQVILSWSTLFEIDNEGFIILRAESPNGPFTPITQGVIPAMGGGFKATYTFMDANVEQGKTYYRLQDIDNRGRVTAHNVVTVMLSTAGIPTTLSLSHKGGGEENPGQVVEVARKDETPQQEALYRPYFIEKHGHRLSMVFRDHQLSDLIGFIYSKWDSKRAAEDLIDLLHRIRRGVVGYDGDHLVSIILDGENVWEHYRNDGHDFLSYLYERLSKEEALKTVRVSDYLKEHPPARRIERLFPGPWINHNFKIWIGG